MADETSISLDEAAIRDLADGGHIVTLNGQVPGRLPVAAIKTAADLAATAVQSGTLGGAAFERADAYMRVADHNAQMAAALARIKALEDGTGNPTVVAPVVSGVAITGSGIAGTAHTAVPTVTGNPTPTLTYQWLRVDGEDVTEIAGATGATYTPPAGNVVIKVSVTAVNLAGSDAGDSPPRSIVPVEIGYNGQLTDVTLTAGTSFSRVWSTYFPGASAYSVGTGLTGGVSSGAGGVNYNVASLAAQTVTFSVTATNATGGSRTVTFMVNVQATGTAASWVGNIPDQILQIGTPAIDIDLTQYAAGSNLVFASTSVLSPFVVTASGRLQSSALSSVVAQYAATVSVDNEWGPASISNSFRIEVTGTLLPALTTDEINVSEAINRFSGWRTPRIFPTPFQPYAPGAGPLSFTNGSDLVKVMVDPAKAKPLVGQRINISGAAAKNGVLIDGDYSVHSQVSGSSQVNIQLAQAFAGTTGTGGGSSVLVTPLFAGFRWTRRSPDANGVVEAAYYDSAFSRTVTAAEGSTPAKVEIQLLMDDSVKNVDPGSPSNINTRSNWSVWHPTESASFRLMVQFVAGGAWTQWSGAVAVPQVAVVATSAWLPISPRTPKEYLAGHPGNHGIQFQRQRVRDLSRRAEYKNRGLSMQDENSVREWRIIDGKLYWSTPRLAGMYCARGGGLYLNSDDADGAGLMLVLGGAFATPYNTGSEADCCGLYRSDKDMLTATKITASRNGVAAFTNIQYCGNSFDVQGNHICRRPQIFDGNGVGTLTDTQRPIYVVEHLGPRGAVTAIYLFKSTNGGASFAFVRELPFATFSDGDDAIQCIACAPNGDLIVSCAKGCRISTDGGVNWTSIYDGQVMPVRLFGGNATTPSGAYLGVGQGDKFKNQPSHGVYKTTDIRNTAPSLVLQNFNPTKKNGVTYSQAGFVWDLDVDPDNANRVAVCMFGAAKLTTSGGANWSDITDSPTMYNGAAADESWRYDITTTGPAGYHSGFIFLPSINVGNVATKYCVGFTAQTTSLSSDGGASFKGNDSYFFNGLHVKGHGVSNNNDWREISYGCQDSTINVMENGSASIEPIGYGTGSDDFKTVLANGVFADTTVFNYLAAFSSILVPSKGRVIACVTRNVVSRRCAYVIFEGPNSAGEYQSYTIKSGLSATRGHYAAMSPKGTYAFLGRYVISNLEAAAATGVTFVDRSREFMTCFLRGNTLVSYWLNVSVGSAASNNFGNIIYRGTADDGTNDIWFTLTSRVDPRCLAADPNKDERVIYTPVNEKNAIYEIARNSAGNLVSTKIFDFTAPMSAKLTAEGVTFIPGIASYVHAIVADPNAPNVFYAAVGIQGCPNIWVSTNGGSSWTFCGEGIPRTQYDLWVHPQTSDLLGDCSLGAPVLRAHANAVSADKGKFYDQTKAQYEGAGIAPPAFF